MSLFKNHYRIESTRIRGYDYSSPGMYFITVCTKDRERYFGEIVNNKITYSPIGIIANRYWLDIPHHFPFISLDEFIVMPNHIHGLIIINDNISVETRNCASLRPLTDNVCLRHYNKFGPQSKNLSAVIRSYKSTVKKFANNHNFELNWQPRFYEHIIRDGESLNRIREYIRNNLDNWQKDRNNQN
ncbi:MAG: transposase [Candidatus Komeilibacteria bacterium]|nr:transposase [Candidatus Komeilibacteria bacterium]